MGRIGDDDYGKKVTASLRNAGVNTDYLVVDPDTQTGLALMPIEPGTGRYVCYVAMGGNDRLCPEDVKKPWTPRLLIWFLCSLKCLWKPSMAP